jgi:hypothetical protein
MTHRAGQALMYASGITFGVLGGVFLAFYAASTLTNDPSWFLTAVVIIAAYWWIFPILAVMGFIGWYLGRGTSRGASIAMAAGGGVFTFAIFFLLALTNFWGPLMASAALMYVPSLIVLGLGIHSYVSPPVGYYAAGKGPASLILERRRVLREAVGVEAQAHSAAEERSRRRVLR